MRAGPLFIALASCSELAPPKSSWHAERRYPGFGSTVGAAGDVNGDGTPDLLVGDDGARQEGIPPAVWIVSGKDGSVIRFLSLPASDSFLLHVDGAFRFDGDDVPDVLTSTRSLGEAGTGTFSLISGKSGAILHSIVTPGFAWGVSGWPRVVGDFDRDGTSDVGALSLSEQVKRGILTVYSGKSGAQITSIPVADEWGSMTGSLLAVGDFDADGTTDFAVLTDGETFPGEGHAALRLYSGARKTTLWEHRSARPYPRAFGAITLLGDLDRDGIPEIAVSFNDCVDVVSGKNGKLVYRLEPEDNTGGEMCFGWAIAATGDIDGDGVIDFALTETESGAFSGMVRARSGKDGRAIWDADGGFRQEIWHLGYSLAALGDIDGDGVSDLVVGTWEVPSGSPGVARVLSGKSGSLLYQFGRKGDDVVVTRRSSRTANAR